MTIKEKLAELAEKTGNVFLAGIASEIGKPDGTPRAAQARVFDMDIPAPEQTRAMREIHEVSNLFESPIEEIAAYQIMGQKFGAHYPRMSKSFTGDHVVTIVPQVSFHPFRLDFCIYLRGSYKVALECDGKDFHDEEKDAFRDRRLKQVHGVDVVRVTGREIYRGTLWAETLAFKMGEKILA